LASTCLPPVVILKVLSGLPNHSIKRPSFSRRSSDVDMADGMTRAPVVLVTDAQQYVIADLNAPLTSSNRHCRSSMLH
jgi:hypothetical protein